MAQPHPKEKDRPSVKEEARSLLDKLPENATWQDVVYAFHVRASIEAGLKDSNEGRVKPVSEVRKKFGLPK